MVRELIADHKERNDRDREATEYADERLGTHQVGGRAKWAFDLKSEWQNKGRVPHPLNYCL